MNPGKYNGIATLRALSFGGVYVGKFAPLQSSSSRLAAGGETVLITDRDRVVAEIVPPQPGRSPLVADARLAEAVREGWLAPPLLAGSDPPPRKPVMTLRDLMQDLQRDREDR